MCPANAYKELDIACVAAGVDVLFLMETKPPPDCCVTVSGFVTLYPDPSPQALWRLLALLDCDITVKFIAQLISSSRMGI